MARVLIVEDTDVQAALLRQFVRERHTVVGTGSSAEAGVQLVRETTPDVVVMDLNLENGNGVDATASIKARDPSIAVIISTVHVSDEMREGALEAGADEYLFKPYSQEDLLAAIDEVLQN